MGKILTKDNPLYTEVQRMMAGDFSNYQVFYNLTVNDIYDEIIRKTGDSDKAKQNINDIYNMLYSGISTLNEPDGLYDLIETVVNNYYSDASMKEHKINTVNNGMTEITQNERVNIKWVKYAGIAAVILACIILVVVFTRPKIDLNKYLIVEYDGCSGYAKINCSLDYEKLAVDYQKNFYKAYNLSPDMNISISGLEKDFQRYIGIQVGKEDKVANGDKINITWKVDEKAFKKFYGIGVKYSDTDVVAAGLAELKVFNLFDYYDLGIEGADGYGKINDEYLWDEAEKDDIPYTSLSISQKDNLKNGDEVVVSVDNYDDYVRYCEKLGIYPEQAEKIIVVSGLSELTEFDPFDYMEVSYDNVTPGNIPDLKVKDGAPLDIEFRTYDSEAYEGNTITIYAEEPDAGYFSDHTFADYCIEKSYNPTRTEMEYTIAGAPRYYEKVEELPDELKEKMDTAIRESFEAKRAKGWSDSRKLQSMELIGYYVLSLKDYSRSGTKNYIYSVYEINVNESRGKVHYYTAYYFYNVYQAIDGTSVVDLDSLNYVVNFIDPNDSISVFESEYIGYQYLDSLYKEAVTSYIDKYNYDSSVEN